MGNTCDTCVTSGAKATRGQDINYKNKKHIKKHPIAKDRKGSMNYVNSARTGSDATSGCK